MTTTEGYDTSFFIGLSKLGPFNIETDFAEDTGRIHEVVETERYKIQLTMRC